MVKFLNKDFFSSNRKKLYDLIADNSLIVLFPSDSYPRSGNQFFKYRQNSDIFYYSGLMQEETMVLLYKAQSNKYEEYVFIIEPDNNMLVWTGHKLSTNKANETSGIRNIEYIKAFDEILKILLIKADNVYFSFSGNIRAGIAKNTYIERFKNEYQKGYPEKSFLDLDPYSHRLRTIKENSEIETIKAACKITERSFMDVMKLIKPGIYECQIEAEITRTFISSGAQGFSFQPIIASGEDSCVLHYITNNKICKDGELLLLDYGSELDNYASDVSRTVPVSGKYTKRQKEVYDSVLNVLNKIKQNFVVGNTINDLNRQCGEYIQQELLRLNLLSEDDISTQDPDKPAYKKYFMHGVSHYIGLDVHDVGDRSEPLKPGMILSCEPGIYIPEEGFGIRLENDILITENLPVDLCSDIPIETDDIEYYMNTGK